MAATDKIRSVVSVQVPGIRCTRYRCTMSLPYHEGYVYFRTGKRQPWPWQDVIKYALALHISGSFPDLKPPALGYKGEANERYE